MFLVPENIGEAPPELSVLVLNIWLRLCCMVSFFRVPRGSTSPRATGPETVLRDQIARPGRLKPVPCKEKEKEKKKERKIRKGHSLKSDITPVRGDVSQQRLQCALGPHANFRSALLLVGGVNKWPRRPKAGGGLRGRPAQAPGPSLPLRSDVGLPLFPPGSLLCPSQRPVLPHSA